MARQKKNRGSSYKPQEYFRGVKSSADDKKKKRTTITQKVGLKEKFIGFFIIAIILSGSLLLGYVDSAEVTINGPSPYEESSLRTRIQAYLDSNIFRRFKPFVSANAMREYVQQTHPEVAATNVSLNPFSPTASVAVEMRSPAIVWQNQDQSQLAVDISGVAYAEFDEIYHSDLDIVVSDATQPQVQLGTTVVSPQLLSYIQNLDNAVQDKTNIKSHRYELPLAAREIRLKLKNYDVRFSLDRFEEEQALELSQLLRNLNRRKIAPTQYIDLRAEDRAYYK